MLLPLSILLGAALTVLTALAIGRIVLRWAPLELYRDEENALGFVTGSALLSLIVFALCAAGWARRSVFLALACIAILAAIRQKAHRSVRPRFTPLPRFWRNLSIGCFAVFSLLYFCNAMAPEFSPDGISYHLSFVAQYNRAHGFVRIPTNMYAQLSQGIELLYLMAFSFGRHSSAALVHYAFLLALSLAILSFGRRFGYPVAGVAAALLVYLSPVVGMDATTAYIDVAVAAILFAVFYLLQLWDSQRGTRLLLIVGFVAGFGYAAKYTAFLAVPYAVLFVLWRTRRWKPALLVATVALVPIAPWVIKNALWVGNPFSPLLNQWFPNPYVHISMERYWSAHMRRYDLPNLWLIPFEITLWGERLCGFLGPIFLLLPLSLYAARVREGRRLLLAAALFTLPYFANIGTRFFIPPLPFYALALTMTLMNMRLLLGTVILAHAVLSWPGVARIYTAGYPWALGRILVKQALRIESEASWLGRKQPDYKIARLLEEKVPPGARVFTMNGMPEAYTRREVWVRFQSARAESMGDTFFAAFTPDYQPRCSETYRFAPLPARKIRLTQTAPRLLEAEWSISELRVYTPAGELRRRPEWRIKAGTNPWDIQLALDNSPVTRWRTWQPFEPGMYVELDLGATETIHQVQMQSPLDCTVRQVRLELAGSDGKWRGVADSAEIEAVDSPPFMGKAAMRELKLRGADYFFIREGEPGFAEILDNPDAWGLTPIGAASNGRLYRLDCGYPILSGTY